MAPVTEHLADALVTRLPPTLDEADGGGFDFYAPQASLGGIVMV